MALKDPKMEPKTRKSRIISFLNITGFSSFPFTMAAKLLMLVALGIALYLQPEKLEDLWGDDQHVIPSQPSSNMEVQLRVGK